MFQLFLALSLVCLTAASSGPVDLSYQYDKHTLFYPGGAPFKFESRYMGAMPSNQSSSLKDKVWVSFNVFSVAEHAGTHIDAPYHFDKEGRTLEKLPLESLVVKGILVNVTEETGDNADYALPASKLDEWEEQHGPVPNNSVVLVSFGWWKRWPNKLEYFGPEEDMHYPGLSKEAGEWILERKDKIQGVGVDTASADVAINRNFDVHVGLLGHQKYILENVDLRHPLPPTFDLLVMPMKIANGTGGPCRIIVFPTAP